MSGFVLALRASPDRRIDVSALLPQRLGKQSAAEVAHLELTPGISVGDLFRVSGEGGNRLVFDCSSEKLDRVGAGLEASEIVVGGDVGREAGTGMTGGRLTIGGSAGDGVAAAQRGGVVVVRGNAGRRAGDRMRRGVLVIEGDAQDTAASRMVAGTIIVCGSIGQRPGLLMRRGTVVAHRFAGTLSPGFVEARSAPGQVFVHLLAEHVRADSAAASECCRAVSRRFVGDMGADGYGEMLAVDAAG